MGLLKELSVQLYSVREETAKDFSAAIREIAKIGYSGVEFAGYGGLSAKEMVSLLKECGLKSVGSHIGCERLENNLQEEIEYNAAIGTKYMICPWYNLSAKDEVLAFAEKSNVWGEKIKQAGMKFAYHNHAHELDKIDGEFILDIYYANSDPNLVLAEIDTFFLACRGVDIIPYIEKYSGRMELLHVKQCKDPAANLSRNLNDGVIDFKTVIQAALNGGCSNFVVEQEGFDMPVFEAMKINYEHIMGL